MKGRKHDDRENEIKLAIASAAAGRKLLRAAGFTVEKPRVFEVNLVLDTPEHTILHGGALLRLRQVGKCGVLTYKGPSEAGSTHKSRQEVESDVDDPAAVSFILERLGYKPVFRYEKYRTEWKRRGESGTATVDETPLGAYMELEGRPSWVDRTARRLGFQPEDYITRSYGKLWAEHRASQNEPFVDMVFPAARHA